MRDTESDPRWGWLGLACETTLNQTQQSHFCHHSTATQASLREGEGRFLGAWVKSFFVVNSIMTVVSMLVICNMVSDWLKQYETIKAVSK